MMKSNYKIREFGKKIDTYDPKEFLIDDTIGNVYCFPFDVFDSSPTAKQWSGRSYGRIEWLFEPRDAIWDRSEKRYYIKKLLVWATQTRDKRYYNKIFSIDCNVESISGMAHKFRDYELGVINQTWNMAFSPHTKTPIFDTYPEDNFDLLLIEVTSSISLDLKFLRFDLLPTNYQYYENIKNLHNQITTYVN